MKITEFELGKKYFRSCFDSGWYYSFDEAETLILCDCNDLEHIDLQLNYDDIRADDWQEYKEVIDYGTKENPKLMLVCYANETFWVEGYDHPGGIDQIVTATNIREGYAFKKSRVLKIIDLPSKEL